MAEPGKTKQTKERASKKPAPPRDKQTGGLESDRVGLGALAALVVGLAVVVWLALPKDSDLAASADGGGITELASEAGAGSAADPAGEAPGGHALERLGEASSELAVLIDKPDVEVAKIASVENVAKLLEARHCGATCDKLKTWMADHEHFEIEIVKTEDYILPAKDSWETISPGLTAAERGTIGTRASTVVIRAHGTPDIEQLPLRATFAATAAVAESLSGIIYDEVVRRIETPALFAERLVKAPLGQNVFLPKQISVQLYRQEDGTSRLLTLGMVRFGSPDFTMRDSTMAVAPSLASIINVVASRAAAGRTELPVVVSLADVASVSGHALGELAKDPKSTRSIALDATDFERVDGDPENEMLELVPPGGASTAAWTSAVAGLFGEAPKIVFAENDKELQAIATRARRELPAAVKRFEGGEGALFVKGPFPIPEASRLDGGAKEEWMWIEVSSCDAKGCAGVLSNSPGYATNLSAGTPVTVARERTADWLLRARDGGAAGGESIKALQRR